MPRSYQHIVLFTMKPGTHLGQHAQARSLIFELCATAPGVINFFVGWSLDQRKGLVLVQNVLFRSQEAFQDFRASTAHHEAAEFLSGVCDWTIGDYQQE